MNTSEIDGYLSRLDAYLQNILNTTKMISTHVKNVREEGAFLEPAEYRQKLIEAMNDLKEYRSIIDSDIKQISAISFILNNKKKDGVDISGKLKRIKVEISNFVYITDEYIKDITDIYTRVNLSYKTMML